MSSSDAPANVVHGSPAVAVPPATARKRLIALLGVVVVIATIIGVFFVEDEDVKMQYAAIGLGAGGVACLLGTSIAWPLSAAQLRAVAYEPSMRKGLEAMLPVSLTLVALAPLSSALGTSKSPFGTVTLVVFAPLTLALVLCSVSVLATGRPRRLVPPAMRGNPDWIRETGRGV